MTPRLTPIERPKNLLLKFAYWISKRRFGKVVTPLKIIYARKPKLVLLSSYIDRTFNTGLSLDTSLRFLVQAQVAQLNGCTFCEDLALAEALRHRIGIDRFRTLSEYRTSVLFTERERTALSLVEEATTTKQVSDATWTALHHHFSEKEIVELAWAIAAETYFNIQARVFEIKSDRLATLAAT